MFQSGIRRISLQFNKITKFTQLSLARMHVTSYTLNGNLPQGIAENRKNAMSLLSRYNTMHYHYSTDKSIYGAIVDSNNSNVEDSIRRSRWASGSIEGEYSGAYSSRSDRFQNMSMNRSMNRRMNGNMSRTRTDM